MAFYEFVDPEQRRETVKFLAGLQSPIDHRINVEVVPQSEGLAFLAAALFAALEKDFTLPGAMRNATEAYRIARGWVIGERVKDIFIGPMDELAPQLHHHVYELAEDAGSNLWMFWFRPVPATVSSVRSVSQGRATRLLSERERREITEMSLEEFVARWRDAERTASPTPSAPFPSPPDEGFALFLDRAKRDCSPPVLLQITEAWQRGRDGTADAIRRRTMMDEDTAAGVVRRLVPTANSFHEIVCLLRGAQAALFLGAGLLMKVDLGRFARNAPIAYKEILSSETASTMRAFRKSSRSAACLIRLVSHATADEIAALRMSDIGEHGDCVHVAGGRATVPDTFAGILRAHRVARLSAGAIDSDPLFVITAGGRRGPVSSKGITTWLKDATDAGIPLTTRFARRGLETDRQWARRHGIQIQRIARNAGDA
jgi:hypothetical protein